MTSKRLTNRCLRDLITLITIKTKNRQKTPPPFLNSRRIKEFGDVREVVTSLLISFGKVLAHQLKLNSKQGVKPQETIFRGLNGFSQLGKKERNLYRISHVVSTI